MTTRQLLLEHLHAHPGATNSQLAEHFKVAPSYTATRTKQLYDGGYVTRKEVGRTVTKSPIYGYYAHHGVTPDMTKKERVAHTKEHGEMTVGGTDLTSMIQGLSDAIAKQIAAQVVVSLQSSLPRELAGVVPPAPQVPKLNLAALPAPPPVISAKPRVGIVGLLPQQAEIISNEFGDVFDLRYWKDESTSALKAMGRSCELVVVTKWSDHSATETLKSVGATYRFVAGGLSDIKAALTALYVES